MGVLCLGVCVITAAWRPGGDPSLTGSADVPPLGMSALSATKSQPSGAYIPTKSVGTYAPPLSYHTDSRGEGCLLGLHSGRPAKEVGLNRLRKNLDGVSFRGAAGDEESCIALKTLRARFLAPLGMTAWPLPIVSQPRRGALAKPRPTAWERRREKEFSFTPSTQAVGP